MSDEFWIPVKKEGLLERKTGDAVIVMTETGDVLHTLEGSGLFVWTLLDKRNSISGILNLMMEEYGISADVAKADLEPFLISLKDNGLIN